MSIVSPWYQLGYVIPHLYTDMDAYQFYRVAPDGLAPFPRPQAVRRVRGVARPAERGRDVSSS